jgi:hypothetical protein
MGGYDRANMMRRPCAVLALTLHVTVGGNAANRR